MDIHKRQLIHKTPPRRGKERERVSARARGGADGEAVRRGEQRPDRSRVNERTRRSIVRLTGQTKRTLKGKRGRSATTGRRGKSGP
ncbi:uncharacterized protein MICPUCDRAFT_55054 [Micromonas pusilla CCMP1545]|uniref:Predicted protein n=1 Tax=Micromonas pusilla (strain CCMP1545) TaxID=564608 RepID=C1MJQ4_MICPC|nr:uncharacterized protein MICPUCDRAFT_55054 [Micromonas pusilla CCMP1545]EEH59236.1 predicted protein [Micromonas pusilla CCMP1545]|eukprot:XP_003055860.1 predicted protein [Micromonas pusilla CCMP1545]